MKIVNKSEFYKLPIGTIYSEYTQGVFSGLKIKHETLYDEKNPVDYYELDLIGNFDFECIGRNGLYEDEQLYAVYEEKDIKNLVNLLNGCKGI